MCSQIPSCPSSHVGTWEDICRQTAAFDRICLPTRCTGRVSWTGFLTVLNACGAYISQGNTLKRGVNLDGKGVPETPVIVQTVGWIFCVHFKLFKLIKHWNTRSEIKKIVVFARFCSCFACIIVYFGKKFSCSTIVCISIAAENWYQGKAFSVSWSIIALHFC